MNLQWGETVRFDHGRPNKQIHLCNKFHNKPEIFWHKGCLPCRYSFSSPNACWDTKSKYIFAERKYKNTTIIRHKMHASVCLVFVWCHKFALNASLPSAVLPHCLHVSCSVGVLCSETRLHPDQQLLSDSWAVKLHQRTSLKEGMWDWKTRVTCFVFYWKGALRIFFFNHN